MRAWERRSADILKWYLGSSPGRLFLEGISESAVLVMVALVLGWVASGPTMNLLLMAFPPDMSMYIRDAQSASSVPMIAGMLAIGVVAMVVSGVAPARIAASVPAPWGVDGRGGSRRSGRMMRAAVFAQASVAVALLTASVWTARSLAYERGNVQDVLARNYLLFEIDPVATSYSLAERARGLEALTASLRYRGDVRHVAYARVPPLARSLWMHQISDGTGTSAQHGIHYNVVSDGYFDTIRLPLRTGRAFDSRDVDGAPPVVVVSESLARQLWPGESAVGQYLRLMGETAPRTVIGVVTDAGGSGPVEMAYLPYGQEHPASSVPVILHVEPHGDGAGIADVVTLQLRRELPSVVEPRMRSIEGQFASATRQTTVAAGVSSGMSGVALLLTATGVFSGVSYSASRRQREWAIRLAMGARPRAVVRHAVSDGWQLPASAGYRVRPWPSVCSQESEGQSGPLLTRHSQPCSRS